MAKTGERLHLLGGLPRYNRTQLLLLLLLLQPPPPPPPSRYHTRA
jgi:hypothetical protein